MTVFTSFTRASFLNTLADHSSSWLIRTSFPKSTILPYYSLCKMSKNGNTSPLFKILFFKNIWIYIRLILFLHCSNQRCTVDLENRRFYILFLRLIWGFARDWLYRWTNEHGLRAVSVNRRLQTLGKNWEVGENTSNAAYEKFQEEDFVNAFLFRRMQGDTLSISLSFLWIKGKKLIAQNSLYNL